MTRKGITVKAAERHYRNLGWLARERDRDKVLTDLMALEDLARRCGLHVTARGLNRAKNALGWELQGEVSQAAAALVKDHAP